MNKNKSLLIIFCILLPLFLLLFSYKTTLFFTELTADQESTMNFLNDKGELELDYTINEKSHLQDVKQVMNNFNYLFYFSLLILTLIITYYKKDQKQLKKLFKFGGITTVISLLVLLILILINFNYTFTIFHKLFFPQGNWIFVADSLLIQTFPIEFFIKISRIIFIQALILGSVSWFITKK